LSEKEICFGHRNKHSDKLQVEGYTLNFQPATFNR